MSVNHGISITFTRDYRLLYTRLNEVRRNASEPIIPI